MSERIGLADSENFRQFCLKWEPLTRQEAANWITDPELQILLSDAVLGDFRREYAARNPLPHMEYFIKGQACLIYSKTGKNRLMLEEYIRAQGFENRASLMTNCASNSYREYAEPDKRDAYITHQAPVAASRQGPSAERPLVVRKRRIFHQKPRIPQEQPVPPVQPVQPVQPTPPVQPVPPVQPAPVAYPTSPVQIIVNASPAGYGPGMPAPYMMTSMPMQGPVMMPNVQVPQMGQTSVMGNPAPSVPVQVSPAAPAMPVQPCPDQAPPAAYAAAPVTPVPPAPVEAPPAVPAATPVSSSPAAPVETAPATVPEKAPSAVAAHGVYVKTAPVQTSPAAQATPIQAPHAEAVQVTPTSTTPAGAEAAAASGTVPQEGTTPGPAAATPAQAGTPATGVKSEPPKMPSRLPVTSPDTFLDPNRTSIWVPGQLSKTEHIVEEVNIPDTVVQEEKRSTKLSLVNTILAVILIGAVGFFIYQSNIIQQLFF